MISKEDLYYLKLMEECAEVQQRVSKLLQFGPNERQAESKISNLNNVSFQEASKTNQERLQAEYCDLLAVGYLLGLFGPSQEQIEAKRQKIEKYWKYAEELRYNFSCDKPITCQCGQPFHYIRKGYVGYHCVCSNYHDHNPLCIMHNEKNEKNEVL